MRQRLVISALVLATAASPCLAAASSAPGSSAGSPAQLGRTGGWGQDSPSLSAFIAQLRADAERGPVRTASLQEAVSRLVPDLPHLPRCLTPMAIEVSRQSAGSPALAAA